MYRPRVAPQRVVGREALQRLPATVDHQPVRHDPLGRGQRRSAAEILGIHRHGLFPVQAAQITDQVGLGQVRNRNRRSMLHSAVAHGGRLLGHALVGQLARAFDAGAEQPQRQRSRIAPHPDRPAWCGMRRSSSSALRGLPSARLWRACSSRRSGGRRRCGARFFPRCFARRLSRITASPAGNRRAGAGARGRHVNRCSAINNAQGSARRRDGAAAATRRRGVFNRHGRAGHPHCGVAAEAHVGIVARMPALSPESLAAHANAHRAGCPRRIGRRTHAGLIAPNRSRVPWSTGCSRVSSAADGGQAELRRSVAVGRTDGS